MQPFLLGFDRSIEPIELDDIIVAATGILGSVTTLLTHAPS
ncbi:hypothetical protein ACFQL7_28080 [Halocatena marina]|uniref:Uncharacterized protein n=1 Tax=Halocatena marina TaxID=2934937 RepID=A0ABD5YYU0_9EURY